MKTIVFSLISIIFIVVIIFIVGFMLTNKSGGILPVLGLIGLCYLVYEIWIKK